MREGGVRERNAGVESKSQAGAGEMHSRKIMLADGRYLIFYTFGGESCAPREGGGDTGAQEARSRSEPPAEDERRV